MAKIFPIDFEEKNTIAQDDYILFSDSEDGDKIKKAQYSNLKGEKGDTGTAATVSVGSTTTGAAGTSASVTNSGTSSAAVLNFTIPKGADGTNGQAATISIGTTTTLNEGESATVTNSGTSSAAVFNFGIPKGDTGATGATGNGISSITSSKVGKTTTVTITETNGNSDSFTVEDGADGQGAGDVVGPNSSTDGDLAMFDGATGKLIKDGGALTTKVFTLSSTSDTTNAQAAYDWYKAGKAAIILYSGNYYYFKSTATNSVYFAVNGYTPLDNTDVTSLVQKTLTLGLSGTTVTSISSWNMSMTGYNVLKTGKDYSTPYTPQYDGSPATKKYVDDSVSTLMGLGKFLSLWDATTGQPISFPLDTPYTYTTGDYFLVETVSTATPPVNYKPNGSSYTGTASSTTESDELAVGDIYIYDGTTWLLQINHGKSVSFANLAGQPSDNTALDNALDAKQDALTLPATPTSGHLVTWGADNETLTDGGAVPTGFAPGGTATTGYVVTKTAGGYEWAAPSGGDVMVSSQSGNILTSGMKIWAGTQANYDNLGTYDNNTVYLTI